MPKDTFVYVSSGNPIVDPGIVDLISSVVTTAQPGFWQAAADVPAQVVVGGITKYNVPVFPYPGDSGYDAGPPVTGDLDINVPVLMWIYWGALNC